MSRGRPPLDRGTITKQSELDELVTRCSPYTKGGLREFAHTFRPETFYVQTPLDLLTQSLFSELEDMWTKYSLFLVHRGGGKTSLVDTAILQRIVYRLTNCLMYCSRTETKAMQETESIKWELETNKELQAVYGNLKSDVWAKDEWQTTRLMGANGEEAHPGSQIVPRGVGQQVRGWLYKGRYRPDFIVVDDIEDRKSVKSETLRKDAWDWFNGEVVGCFSQLSVLGPKETPPKLVVIGNMLHEDCVMNRLREDAKNPKSIWHGHVVEIPMCDDNLRSTRPTFITNEHVQEEYNRYRSIGELNLFAQECQLEVVSKEGQKFKPEYYRYFDENEEGLARRGGLETVVSVDISNSDKATSCPCGIVVQSVDLITGAIYVREVIQERMHPDEQYTMAIDLCIRYGARCLSCGTQGAKEWATYAFENAIRQRNVPVEFVEIPETRREGAKEERVAGLVPLYRAGIIHHAGNKEPNGTWSTRLIPLELAQAKYPFSTYWDAMDAQAQILWLLDNSQRFMHGKGDYPEGAATDEYDELLAEDMAEGPLSGWRVTV